MGACFQKIKHNAKQFIYRSDMFSADACLRIRGEPQYQSMLGGFLSIVMIVFFIVIFANNIVLILQYKQLSAITVQSQNLNPQTSMDDLQFAFNIDSLDLRSLGRTHFHFGLTSRVFINYTEDLSSVENYRLEPCQRSQWENLGGNIPQLFDAYQMDKMLCLPKGQKIQIYGHKSARNYSYLELTIEQCVNTTMRVCATPLQIASSLNSILATQDYLTIKLIVLSAIIDANNPRAVTYKLEDEIWFTFTTTLGTRGAAYFGRYQITTDQSYWPWSIQTVETGNYISRFQTRSYEVKQGVYARFKFIRETVELTITRTYGKLDDMLSYIGGLFGLLFAFFFFFLEAYNQYCYELTIGQSLFKNQQGMKQSNFSLFHYLGYQLYQYLLIFGCKPDWKRMKQIHAARSQAVQQLDARLIMKKLNYFQKVVDILLDQHQKLAIHLTEPHSIEEMSKIRKIHQFSHGLLNSIEANPNPSPNSKSEEKSNQQLVDIAANQIHNTRRGSQVHKIFPFHLQTKVQNEANLENAQNNDIFSQNSQDLQAKESLRSSLHKILNGSKTGIDKKIAERIPAAAKKNLVQGVLRFGMLPNYQAQLYKNTNGEHRNYQ